MFFHTTVFLVSGIRGYLKIEKFNPIGYSRGIGKGIRVLGGIGVVEVTRRGMEGVLEGVLDNTTMTYHDYLTHPPIPPRKFTNIVLLLYCCESNLFSGCCWGLKI